MSPRLVLALPSRLLTGALAAVLALSLAACGGDGGVDTGGSAAAGATGGGSAPVGADADEAFTSAELDTIARAIDAVMADVTGYSIDGTALTLEVDGSRSDAAAKCTIATTVAGSFAVPEGTTITFAYDDGSETC